VPEVKRDNKVICYHCGDVCRNTEIAIDDKYFCCQGCKFVFELLSLNDLSGYYSIENTPGVIPPNENKTRFEYLDDPKIANRLFDYHDDHNARITFFIPKIHCSSCIWLLENLYKLNSGISVSRVNFLRKEVSITFEPDQIGLGELVGLLSSLGYEPDINLGDLDKSEIRKARSKDHLYAQIAVAGFCFANVMLFSFPEYFSSPSEIGEEYRSLFGYLKIILSLPVLLFSASGYLKSAYLGIKQKFINMDVPISLGIVILFSRSAYEIISGTGIGYMDSFTGFIFFLLL